VIDEKPLTDRSTGMDLDPRQESPKVGNQTRDEHPAAHVECVRNAMQPDGVQAAVTEQHLNRAPCRRITLKDNADVTSQPRKHNKQLPLSQTTYMPQKKCAHASSETPTRRSPLISPLF
jgi:hypothetical protein